MTMTMTKPTTQQTIRDLNTRYAASLRSNPLLTKAATLTFFSVLNEQLASFFAGDISHLNVKIPFTRKAIQIPHTMTSRVPLMGLFACLINAPLTHYGYNAINKLVPAPLTPRKKIVQILLSTGIITPLFCSCFIAWISIINNLSKLKEVDGETFLKKLKNVTVALLKTVVSGLKSSFLKVFSTSSITSPLFMLFAQRFVAPEAWAVFFAFCYFVVGTYNNTKVKIAQLKLKTQKEKEMRDLESEKKPVSSEIVFHSESETEVERETKA